MDYLLLICNSYEMMIKTNFGYFFIVSISIVLALGITCQRNDTKKDNYKSLTGSAKNKFQEMRSFVSSLNLKNTINKMATDESALNIRYIYYFKSSVCSNCEQRFDSLEKTSLNKNEVVVVISPLNYKKYQRFNEYMTGYTVLVDSLDLFRKKTKNVYSPMFMEIDSQFNVKSTFQFFGLNDDYNRFISYQN